MSLLYLSRSSELLLDVSLLIAQHRYLYLALNLPVNRKLKFPSSRKSGKILFSPLEKGIMPDYPLPFILREHSVRFNGKARHSIPRIIVPRRSNAWSDKRVSISTNYFATLFFFNYRAKYFARTLPCNSKIQTLFPLLL